MNSYSLVDYESSAGVFKALANKNRLQILHWLSEPEQHFPKQIDGDLIKDGVCVGFITEKIGLKQPTVTSHMQILQEAKLVTSKKIKNWVFYRLVGSQVELLSNEIDRLFSVKR